MRAQIQCQQKLVEISNSDEATAASMKLSHRTRSVLSAITGISRQCGAVHGKLTALSRTGTAVRQPIEAVVALGGLASFEKSAVEALATVKFIDTLVEESIQSGASDMLDLKHDTVLLGSGLHMCLLKTLREARMISHALPLGNAAVRQVQHCKPDMLTGLERTALAEAEGNVNPDITFFAGLLLSELSTAPTDAPFFRAGSEEWHQDKRGISVPADMAKGEEMLMGGLEGSVHSEQAGRAKACTIQLAAHATHLAQLKLNAAAEWRYDASAEVAKKYGHNRMASSSLAQLSYFLGTLGGRHEQALAAANDALRLAEDPLASYMQASLRLELGELRSDAQLRQALQQLQAARGKLPSEQLEEQCAAAVVKLDWWRERSDSGSVTACFADPDVATTLICVLGRVAEMLA
jgi:hypothetical protein